jgi:hypothetical protein
MDAGRRGAAAASVLVHLSRNERALRWQPPRFADFVIAGSACRLLCANTS